jgi:hypothetical protein
VQSTGGCCLIVRDKLHFYVSGRQGMPGTRDSGICTTGLATMRRDGFVSLDAGADGGSVTTRPISFRGSHLFVNAAANQGELTAEVLNESGEVVPDFARAKCVPIGGDGASQAVKWHGADLSQLAGQPIRLRFHLKNALLYSFWVSPDANGASHGFVAAGGPGFTNITDNVGDGIRSR